MTCLSKACYSAVDAPLFAAGTGILAVLPAKQKSPGQISVAVGYSLKGQVLQGKPGMTPEK